jgi:poly(ADP-ribose) glycohydrolase ARH3
MAMNQIPDPVEPNATLRDRFRGVMLGTLCGDALGAPAEGLAREQIIPTLGGWLHEMIDRPLASQRAPSMLRAGRYTDDTQMTQALAEALLDMDDVFDPDEVARSFALWFQEFRGYGGKAQRILTRLRSLYNAGAVPGLWSKAVGPEVAADGASFGNGSAMRVAPVALACYPDAKRVANLAERQGRLTGHSHPDAQFGAQQQALAVMLGIQWGEAGKPLGPDFVNELLALLPTPPESFAARLAWLPQNLHASGDDAVAHLGHGVVMAESVPTALWAVLSSPADRGAVGAITRGANLGGDADTIAAMAGAIAGGYYGASSLPQHWLEAVESGIVELSLAGEKGQYAHGRDRLVQLADGLLDLALAGGLQTGRSAHGH